MPASIEAGVAAASSSCRAGCVNVVSETTPSQRRTKPVPVVASVVVSVPRVGRKPGGQMDPQLALRGLVDLLVDVGRAAEVRGGTADRVLFGAVLAGPFEHHIGGLVRRTLDAVHLDSKEVVADWCGHVDRVGARVARVRSRRSGAGAQRGRERRVAGGRVLSRVLAHRDRSSRRRRTPLQLGQHLRARTGVGSVQSGIHQAGVIQRRDHALPDVEVEDVLGRQRRRAREVGLVGIRVRGARGGRHDDEPSASIPSTTRDPPGARAWSRVPHGGDAGPDKSVAAPWPGGP